jgi:Na+/H+-dicarboxylate symporter
VAIDFIDAMYDTFLTVLDWVLYLLPFGLFCLMASQAAKVGGSAIKAMLAIIALYMTCFAIMTALYLFALRRSTGRSLKEVLAALKQTFTLAFVASADSALHSAMTQMAKLGLPRNLLSSVIPLSAATNRHATAIMFAIIAFFVADVYDVNLNLWQTLFVAFGCALVGAFDSGEYVTIAPMIAYVLIPLGLPAAPGIAIILTIWPMIEWFAELQTVMAACSNAAIIANVGADKPGKAT